MFGKASILRLFTALAVLALAATTARADSVAQISTAVRIDRATAALIDPQRCPPRCGGGMETRTAVRVGDVLTFTAEFTPVPNGAVRGLGGYVTVYIPRNTEVAGARLVDATGATVAPHRGGLSSDGAGPRGASTFTAPLVGGSMSQLYADTGIFFATDPRTNRFPDGSVPADRFLSVFNGIQIGPPETTAFGQLDVLLGAINLYAHNDWDAIQAYGFGVDSAALGGRGRGHTPDMYGSPVAGPGTWYPNEAELATGMPLVLANVQAGMVGPWQRVQTLGAETGRRGNSPPMPDPGLTTRVGVPAVDMMGRPLGVVLNGGSPLPSYDAMMPANPYTRAIRFAVGELVVGDVYKAEFSLRVLAVPLDPVSMSDVVCAEVFGGDASAQDAAGNSKGKDHAWRYFLPAPSCVSLDLLFDLDVSAPVILPGGTLTYAISGKNLATTAHNNVTVRHCFIPGEVTYVSSMGGPMGAAPVAGTLGGGAACPTPGSQSVSWTVPLWDRGAEFNYTLTFTATGGGNNSIIGRAIFTSDELVAPGFQTVAFTVIDAITNIDLTMTATPTFVATPSLPATVTYTATVDNVGTGPAVASGCAAGCRVQVTLPPGFVYVAGTATTAAGAVGDPAITPAATGDVLAFTAGILDLPPGGNLTLTFDATVPAGTADGAYTGALETWYDDPGGGMAVNDAIAGVAEVVVGTPRSDAPTVTPPLYNGGTTVTGTSTEAPGSTVRIYLNGVEAATAMVGPGGAWTATVPVLFAGQAVSATVQATGELESLRSAEVTVLALDTGSVTPQCSDMIDNDGDGLIDFPMDPDCTSASDPFEGPIPECSDGVDNDMDGFTDFGPPGVGDPGCSSLLDDSEAGPPECSDGIDNDMDGFTDFTGGDPGCTDANDVSEFTPPQCSDGIDNDGDMLIDFPRDPDCISSLDDDESMRTALPACSDGIDNDGDGLIDLMDPGCTSATDTSEVDVIVGPDADTGVPDADSGGETGLGGGDPGPMTTRRPPDPGGVDDPGACCAVAPGSSSRDDMGWALIALFGGLAFVRRRRR